MPVRDRKVLRLGASSLAERRHGAGVVAVVTSIQRKRNKTSRAIVRGDAKRAAPIKGIIEPSWILEVDPAELDPEKTYTIEMTILGIPRQWTGIRPQREEDGKTRIYLPFLVSPP